MGLGRLHFLKRCLSFASFLLRPSPPQLDVYLCWVPLSLLLLSLSKRVSLAQVHASGNRQQDNQNKLSGIAELTQLLLSISLYLLSISSVLLPALFFFYSPSFWSHLPQTDWHVNSTVQRNMREVWPAISIYCWHDSNILVMPSSPATWIHQVSPPVVLKPSPPSLLGCVNGQCTERPIDFCFKTTKTKYRKTRSLPTAT